jgi:hypothetical protein
MPAKPTPAATPKAHSDPIDLEDLWVLADKDGKPGPVLTFDEMNAAKARNAERRAPNPER